MVCLLAFTFHSLETPRCDDDVYLNLTFSCISLSIAESWRVVIERSIPGNGRE